MSAAEAPDPWRERVYAAEDAAAPDGGRRFTRFEHLESFVDAALAEEWWERRFPDAPMEAVVERRSHSARYSLACVDHGERSALVLVRSGSWNVVTVVHELAHVAASSTPLRGGAHGADFVDALVDLWRRHLGLHAYGALRSELAARGIVIDASAGASPAG